MRAETRVLDAATRHPLTPSLWRVVGRHRAPTDVVTLELSPETGSLGPFRPGQFHMLTAFGVGEIAVSISSAPSSDGPLEHTIRDVGAVSHALCEMPLGGLVGVRGPYGRGWRLEASEESRTDYVIVAGGLGLAPLRGAIRHLMSERRPGKRLFLLVGARSPDQIVFADELEKWRQAGAHLGLSVDVARPGWQGSVGVVTGLINEAPFDPERTVAFVCGPEIMMRFVARALVDRGVDPDKIELSLERNMQCGCGWCGHCQLGPLTLCLDGPVVTYGGLLAELLAERQR